MNVQTEITITEINEFYQEAVELRSRARQLDQVAEFYQLRKITDHPEYQHSLILAEMLRCAAASLIEVAKQADKAFRDAYLEGNCSCNPRNDPCAACSTVYQIQREHEHLAEEVLP